MLEADAFASKVASLLKDAKDGSDLTDVALQGTRHAAAHQQAPACDVALCSLVAAERAWPRRVASPTQRGPHGPRSVGVALGRRAAGAAQFPDLRHGAPRLPRHTHALRVLHHFLPRESRSRSVSACRGQPRAGSEHAHGPSSQLPPPMWQGFLATGLSSVELVAFALATFVYATWGIRGCLLRHIATSSSTGVRPLGLPRHRSQKTRRDGQPCSPAPPRSTC